MVGGNCYQVDNYWVCCIIGVDGDFGGLNCNICDFIGFINVNYKVDVLGLFNEVQKMVVIVFVEDYLWQKLVFMQGVLFKFVC